MNYKTQIVITILLPLLLASGVVFAQSDQFIISQQVLAENPPQAPQNLSATAVSTSQIDLSWDASVPGDYGISGYKIFRDNQLIATTTEITYSDTGLNSNTTYTYKVSAFDTLFQNSALSNPASATTFPEEEEEVTPLPETSVGGGGSLMLRVESFTITPGLDNAIIELKTNLPTIVNLRWGKTVDYELGSLSSSEFKEDNAFLIPNLKPDTRYFFRLEITDGLSRKIILDNQEFKTLSFAPVELPLNVSNLKATANDKEITLTWKNPPTNFKAIRIIRSDKFFPRDPFDGELVFESVSEKFIDKEVQTKIIYYYAVFVKDLNGIYSSGALVHARIIDEEFPEPPDLFAGVIDLPPSEVHPLINSLTLKDFHFIQDEQQAKFISDDTVLIKGDRLFKVWVDYNKFPEVLKTIAVTLKDPTDSKKFFSFLLRVNQDKSAFEASIAPLGREGFFGLNVSILDHKNRGLRKLSGLLKSILPFVSVSHLPVLLPPFLIWFVSILLMLLGLFGFFIRRLRTKRIVNIEYEAKT